MYYLLYNNSSNWFCVREGENFSGIENLVPGGLIQDAYGFETIQAADATARLLSEKHQGGVSVFKDMGTFIKGKAENTVER